MRMVICIGGGFVDLTYSHCKSITLADDFRNQVHMEVEAIFPRGQRDTSSGIKASYLIVPEISA